MKLVVGLGNPGDEYRSTRHNIGFLALDCFLKRNSKRATKKLKNAIGASLVVNGEECWFFKPHTFMNRSGLAVAPIARKLSVEPSETLVIHDEADLDPGRLQLKLGGGTGGHKGLDSIVAEWNERDFYRLRIGIGKSTEQELADYVLEVVPASVLDPLAEAAADAIEKIFALGADQAMGRINVRPSTSLQTNQ
ncbi:MAG TPA: aminoacyl-tRNA hydrolase [Bdellovibrionota bacterium]|nr:aminoacyl-tRNA hydrolase [Bdellovibrionota bacterium]